MLLAMSSNARGRTKFSKTQGIYTFDSQLYNRTSIISIINTPRRVWKETTEWPWGHRNRSTTNYSIYIYKTRTAIKKKQTHTVIVKHSI